MSGRIRSIKPETHVDEDLWDADVECPGLHLFRAYTGLWCQADREGRFEWRPRVLKPAILPHWDGDFSRVLDALEVRGFVVRYEVDGREYGWIPTFKKHQFPNARETPSKLPPPPTCTHVHARELSDVTEIREVQDVHAPIQIPSLPLPDPIPVPDPDAREDSGEPPPTSPEHPKPADPAAAPLAARALQWASGDRFGAQQAYGAPESWAEVREAFDAFLEIWPSPAARKLHRGDPRADKIVERFADGFTVADLVEAARGAKREEFISARVELQTPLTIWRDGAQVEKFKALGQAPVRLPKRGPHEPTQTGTYNPFTDEVTGGRRNAV